MLGQLVALYNARKDPSLAKRLASEMIVDGAIERASWPLAIGKFWMPLGIIALAIIIGLFIWLAVIAHWTLAIPALPLAGLAYGIIRLWRGLDHGIETVTKLAKTELTNRVGAFKLPSERMNTTDPVPDTPNHQHT